MSATAGVSRAGARTGLQLLGHGGTQRFNSTNDHEHKDSEKQFQSPGGASTSVSTFGVNTHLDWGKNSACRWPARRPKVHMLIGTFWARTIQQRGGDEPTQKHLRRCQGLCLIAAINVLSNCCIVKHPPFEHPCGRGNSTTSDA